MNTIGNIFRLTTAGESHGEAMTAIVDGMPTGVRVSIDDINEALARRRATTNCRRPERSRTACACCRES